MEQNRPCMDESCFHFLGYDKQIPSRAIRNVDSPTTSSHTEDGISISRNILPTWISSNSVEGGNLKPLTVLGVEKQPVGVFAKVLGWSKVRLIHLGVVRPWGRMEGLGIRNTPYHPWDWYIYLHEWLIVMVNVGGYTSPMDP